MLVLNAKLLLFFMFSFAMKISTFSFLVLLNREFTFNTYNGTTQTSNKSGLPVQRDIGRICEMVVMAIVVTV